MCGHLGHQFKEHGDGVHPPEALVYKNLRASWFRGPGRGPGEGRERGRSGRGRGGGRVSSQRSQERWNEQEFSENMKEDIAMDDAENNRKRGALVVLDPRGSASSMPVARPSNPLPMQQSQDVPASSPSK